MVFETAIILGLLGIAGLFTLYFWMLDEKMLFVKILFFGSALLVILFTLNSGIYIAELQNDTLATDPAGHYQSIASNLTTLYDIFIWMFMAIFGYFAFITGKEFFHQAQKKKQFEEEGEEEE